MHMRKTAHEKIKPSNIIEVEEDHYYLNNYIYISNINKV